MTAGFRAAEGGRLGAEVARWAGDRQSTGPRRGLQVALGMVWLLDAALQYQPFMFGGGFVTQVIAPAQAGNPAPLAGFALSAGHLVAVTQPASNAVFATVQLALGLALLWRPTARAALAGSVAWGLLVWWLGEGLGDVLAGARLFTGAPGAAVLYALLAVLVWPAGQGVQRHRDGAPGRRELPATANRAAGFTSVAAGGLLGERGARLAWFVLWASSICLVLEPGNRAPQALRDAIAAQAPGEPGFLAGLDHQAAVVAGGQGLPGAIAITLIAAVVGCGVFLTWLTRPALALAILLALTIWVVGENFGGILTGHGTDPSTGPLLVLLAAAFWPSGRPSDRPVNSSRESREISAT